MLNNVNLTGRLTKEPEVRVTESGRHIAKFTLAVNRSYRDDQGQQQADFIYCVAWNELAKVIGDHVHKGSLIAVNGNLVTRSFQVEGKNQYVTEVKVNEFHFLESKKEKITEINQYTK